MIAPMRLVLCSRRGCIRQAHARVVLVMPLEPWDSNPEKSETPLLVCDDHQKTVTVEDVMPPKQWTALAEAWATKHGSRDVPPYDNLRLEFEDL